MAGNGSKDSRVLLWAGMIGAFAYLIISEVAGYPFHPEWLLLFAAMMGLDIIKRIDK